MDTQKGYVNSDYLKQAAEELQRIKHRSYTHLQLQNGNRVIDVGCGPATDTIPLANFVGETGQVIGIDIDEEMLNQANKKAGELDLRTRVNHIFGNADHIPFDNDYFDACRSERVLQHLTNPWEALGEMIRVTKPFGKVVILDTDWATFSIDTEEVDIERRLAHFFAENLLNNGFSGRKLLRMFKSEKMSDLDIEIFPKYFTNYAIARVALRLDPTIKEALMANVISQLEAIRWQSNLEKADFEGTFFASLNLILVSGSKPG